MTGAAATSFPLILAAAEVPKQSLIVSLHDVAPSTQAVSEKILRELRRHHVDVCSLLVVPNYHHQGAAIEDREFMRWLRDLEADGHEIVIHGYYHDRPRRGGESVRDRLITRCYTAGEGEFYDLAYEEAFRRITRARDEFSAAGLEPRGFIAPAWLLSPAARQAAADAEMEYTTRLTDILDLRTGDAVHARSMVYSVRTGWRRALSRGWNQALAVLQRDREVVRLGIHPPDAEHPSVWRQIVRLTDQLTEVRATSTYAEWLAERRIARGSSR